MGLLSKSSAIAEEINNSAVADKPVTVEKSNSGSLLERINNLINQSSLDFCDFIDSYKFSLSAWALFTIHENYYYISNSYGFDGKSIISSFSTTSFWNGTIEKDNQIYNFSSANNDLSSFYQFLPEKLKETCKNLSIIKTSRQILLLCSNEDKKINILDSFITELDHFIEKDPSKYNSFSKYFTISVNDAIEKYILSQNILKYNSEVLKVSIIKAIQNKLKAFFGNENIIFCGNLFYVQNDNSLIPNQLLINHIKLNLKEIIGEYTNFIEINFQV